MSSGANPNCFCSASVKDFKGSEDMQHLINLELKNFFRSKHIIILLSLTLIAFVGDWVYYSQKVFHYANEQYAFDAYTVVFAESQKCALYLFIVVLFIAYEIFFLPMKSNVDETLRVTPKGINLPIKVKSIICIVCITFYTMCAVLYNYFVAFYFDVAKSSFLFNILISCLINYFSISVFAVIIGFFASTFQKKTYGYVILVLTTILFSGILQKITDVFLFGMDINIYPVTKIFDIFPPNLNVIFNYSFGLSILPYRVFLILFWCFFFLMLISLRRSYFIHKTIYRSNITTIVFLILCVSSLINFYMPSSKVIRNNDPAESNFHDFNYYCNYYAKHSVDNNYVTDFKIVKYDIEFKVINQLYAKVNMELEQINSNDTYVFTLYHGYKVTNVCDIDGKELRYQREGDYIYVESDTEINNITICYRGYSPQYYSNLQGICLPSGFAYYPIAGYKTLYNVEQQCFNSCLSETPSFFNVKINNINNIYCNFVQNQDDEFSGYSNGLTLVHGMYSSLTIDTITIIYPYLCGDYNEETLKILLGEIEDKSFLENKTILITPNVNQNSGYIFAEEHIVAHASLFSLVDEVNNIMSKELSADD